MELPAMNEKFISKGILCS